MGATTDPASQLIELGQTKTIRIINDDGVDVGDVDAGLDDGRAEQEIKIVADEPENDILEHIFIHLTMTDANARLGNQFAQFRGNTIDRVNTIVHEINLAAPVEFAKDDFAD